MPNLLPSDGITVVIPGLTKNNYFTLDSMKLEIIGGLCLKSQELRHSSA
jgi:hypothetical protein